MVSGTGTERMTDSEFKEMRSRTFTIADHIGSAGIDAARLAVQLLDEKQPFDNSGAAYVDTNVCIAIKHLSEAVAVATSQPWPIETVQKFLNSIRDEINDWFDVISQPESIEEQLRANAKFEAEHSTKQ